MDPAPTLRAEPAPKTRLAPIFLALLACAMPLRLAAEEKAARFPMSQIRAAAAYSAAHAGIAFVAMQHG